MRTWLLMLALAPLVAVVGCGHAAPEPVASAAVPGTNLRYAEREGKALFDHYCVTCHGTTGQGDGFNAYGLDPKPRDLSSQELQSERDDAALALVIRQGGGAAGFSTSMPPWGRVLGERKIGHLVRYLRRLPEIAEEDS